MTGLFLSIRNTPIIENEALSGYLRHVSRALSNDEKKGLAGRIGKNGVRCMSPVFPSKIGPLRELLGRSLPEVPHLILHNSSLPVMRLTSSDESYGRLYENAVLGTRTGIGTFSGATSARGNIRQHFEHAACLECIREDIPNHGRTFVRIQWAFSAYSVCTKHGVPLVTACPRCRESADHKFTFHRLKDSCLCGEPLFRRIEATNRNGMKSEMRVAGAMDALFRAGKKQAFDYRHMHYVYRSQARNLRVLGVRHNFDAIAQLAEKRIHSSVLAKHSISWQRQRNAPKMLLGTGFVTSPVSHALIICTLFDNEEHFESELTNTLKLDEQALLPTEEKKLTRVAYRSPDKEDIHKATIQAYLVENPNASRTEVHHKCRSAIDALRQHNPDSISELLPPSRRGLHAIRSSSQWEAVDAAFCEHVRRRSAEFEEQPPSFRITKARLVKGWRSPARLYQNPSKFPLTLAAIDECRESRGQFRLRRNLERMRANDYEDI